MPDSATSAPKNRTPKVLQVNSPANKSRSLTEISWFWYRKHFSFARRELIFAIFQYTVCRWFKRRIGSQSLNTTRFRGSSNCVNTAARRIKTNREEHCMQQLICGSEAHFPAQTASNLSSGCFREGSEGWVIRAYFKEGSILERTEPEEIAAFSNKVSFEKFRYSVRGGLQ